LEVHTGIHGSCTAQGGFKPLAGFGVGVRYGVRVAVGRGVAVWVAVGLGVGVRVPVGRGEGVLVALGRSVGVRVGVGRGVGVLVEVGRGVEVRVGVGVGVRSAIRKRTTPAGDAMKLPDAFCATCTNPPPKATLYRAPGIIPARV
jgi:hypothetical protein